MKPIALPGFNNSVAQPPTKEIPFWHFICQCGKPVSLSDAWWDGKKSNAFYMFKGNKMKKQAGVTAIEFMFALWVFFMFGAGYVAAHFITKYW